MQDYEQEGLLTSRALAAESLSMGKEDIVNTKCEHLLAGNLEKNKQIKQRSRMFEVGNKCYCIIKIAQFRCDVGMFIAGIWPMHLSCYIAISPCEL